MRIILLSILLLVPLASAAQEEQPSEPIAVGADETQDGAIADRIRSILRELDYDSVAVRVSSGIVTLTGEAPDAAAVTRLDEIVTRVEGVVAIQNEVAESTDVARRGADAAERIENRVAAFAAYLPLLALAGAVLGGVVLLGLFVARRRWPWDRLAPNSFVADIYRQIVRIVFAIAGLVIALDILNAVALLSTILGAAGIIGLAIGFAVRDTVENFIASVMLSFRQPFRPNDLVEIEGDMGKVIRLTSRATILLSLEGNQIRIPNATVFKARIVNYSANPERRWQFEIGVASDADLAAVRALIRRTVEGLDYTLAEPAPQVWIDRIGDGAIFLQVTGWIDNEATGFLRARGEALRIVKDAVEAAGVEVPDTTYRIALTGGGTGIVTATDGDTAEDLPSAPRPAAGLPAETAADAHAELRADAALDRLADAERGAKENEDLLSPVAPTE
ncbi:small-conductance mechanosensitive channel [Hasllibacter halocynthiae]|uniref:Small-conductance mechanosensitive channel n=1 Tax=Hasllibacter halocynthiae TaxID=595589 RepID=A0A2T0X9Y5_9RHOB|nr:mechanosensitive ion channel family protein [Hasllibacter halocynthiae]PRY95713.1 small-conductance mechanosensitive channel [Hasllibacter halocynthiae]